MKTIHRLILCFALLIASLTSSVSFATEACAKDLPTPILKKLKELHDQKDQSRAFLTMLCQSPGLACQSGGDCCGISSCRDGYCSDPGIGDVPPGGHCESSGDCAGISTCNNGFCSDPGIGDVPPGGHCESSGDCAGISTCNDGFCS